MIIGTRAEFEKLADYILKDYLGNDYKSYLPLDVQDFAKNYLKLEISYYEFDPRENIEGMLVNDHIILDSRLKNRERTGERNFTIAHECGHYLINCQENMPCMYTEYRFNRTKRLITKNDFREWQANVVASALLLRPYLVGWAMFTFSKRETIVVYGDYQFSKEDSFRLGIMAEYLGVSKTCLRYRLDCLGMLTHKPWHEYDPAKDTFFPWRLKSNA